MATVEEMLTRRREYASYKNRGLTRKDEPSYGTKYKNGEAFKYETREFIAWDGEGADIDGQHTYVLLKNNKGDEMVRPSGIDTYQALKFLVETKQRYPNATHVIFGGSYDVNMMLKDLTYKHIKMLQENKRVFWKNFNIHYIPRKYFMVSMYPPQIGDKRKIKPIATICMWDVIGFFQGAFVKSLKEYFPNEEEQKELHIPEIEAGKLRRGTFTPQELENFIIPYTQYEVDALVALMNKLRANFEEAGIRLSRWDGAGAAAAAVLNKYGVKQYYPKDLEVKDLEQAGQVAFGGGHVEMYKYGHTKEDIHHYDVIGAYPSVMPILPNLANGEWTHKRSPEDLHPNKNYFSMYKIYWDYRKRINSRGNWIEDDENVIYPFFYRRPWRDPRVYYPRQGYSWVWQPELEAALRYYNELGGELKVLEKWEYVPGDSVKPFAFVSDLYQKRLEYKAKGMGAALALKLAVNSLYGKMAQTVGYDIKDGDKRPPYYNILYAGYVTSSIRAKMFEAMMQAPDYIIAVATDGLWSMKPLKLDIGKGLGQWEYEKLLSFTSVQAGVYFAKKADNEEVYHYRGFNQGSISEKDVISAWTRRDYTINVPTRRFVTMGTAVASEERFKTKWRTWDEMSRSLDLFPGGGQKRSGHSLPDGRPTPNASFEMVDCELNWMMRFEDEIKSVNMLTEKWLSRKHPLPWDEVIAETETEKRIKLDTELLWEITESEV